jgi:poly-gamma-glutamate synthesis protein (capsule biosynthesis protein)
MRLLFVGDVCLANIDTETFDVDPQIVQVLASADLRIANLESPLTISEEQAPHHPITLKAAPRTSQILDALDVFSLANNHILDYGEIGLTDTIKFLGSENKSHFGAGLDEQAALTPLYLDRPERNLAFFGLSRWYHAGPSKAGTAPDRFRKLEGEIQRAKGDNRFVIACPHWNYEYVDYPSPDSVRLAHRLMDAGVDLIVGSHPHVVQGYERYQDKLAFYSLGNFVFHNDEDELANVQQIAQFIRPGSLNQTCILSIELDRNGVVGHEFIPIHSDNTGLRLQSPDQSQAFLQRVKSISRPLTDRLEHRKLFYQQATRISQKSSTTLRMVLRQQGLLSLLRVLWGIRKQDLKIVACSALLRSGLLPKVADLRDGDD